MASGGSCAESVAPEAVLIRPLPSRRPQQPPPEQDYDFVEEPAKEFFCAVSLELLREPQQTDCCGHHLSLEVAQRLQREGKPCPMCQHPHLTARPDKFHKRKVQQLTVRCKYKKNGCMWVGELGNSENHVTKCPKQPWQCMYCTFSGLREVEEEHLSGCGQFPVPCPNGCEAGSVERCSLKQHLLECPLQLVGCEYVAMGCAVRLPRRDMSEHVRQSGQEHLLKMCLENLTVSRELSRKVEEKEQQIAELQEEMRRMERRMKEKMKEMEGRVKEDMGEIEGRMKDRMKERIKEMEGTTKEEKREVDGRMKEMEGRVEERMTEVEGRVKEKMKELEKRMEERMRELEGKEVVSSEGDIIVPPVDYIIHNFSALKAQDKEWRSPPFYSHPGGYKMCIEVWPNGVCDEKGRSVSTMCYVMRDTNTEGLKWPVILTVNTEVLRHPKGEEHPETGEKYPTDVWDQVCAGEGLQEKPSSGCVLSSWNCEYLAELSRCHEPFCPNREAQYGNTYCGSCYDYDYVKDDCLHIGVVSVTVSVNP